jgi:hypothetical protein
MGLAPREQRALLRMERSLSKDPAVRAAFGALGRSRGGRGETTPEGTSPWRPVLWRCASASIISLTAAFAVAFLTILATQM